MKTTNKENIPKSKKGFKKIKTHVGVCQWQTPTDVRKQQTSNKITNEYVCIVDIFAGTFLQKGSSRFN